MISKELLSEVLKESVLSIRPYIEDDIIDENITIYECGKNTYGIIDIYELAHKCKEWAFKNYKIIINSRITSNTKLINGYAEIIKNYDYLYGDYADTEPEAIFKACEWIMENKCGS